MVNLAPLEYRSLKAPKSALFLAWLDAVLDSESKRTGNKWFVELPRDINYIDLAELVHENKCVKIRDLPAHHELLQPQDGLQRPEVGRVRRAVTVSVLTWVRSPGIILAT